MSKTISMFCLGAVFFCTAFFQSRAADAQLQGSNMVDLDLQDILFCFLPEEEFRPIICDILRPYLLDQLVESERFLDAVFAGYRDDLPRFIRNRLDEPIQLRVTIASIDGPGNVLAMAGPDPGGTLDLVPNAFLLRGGGGSSRAWSITRTGTITLDDADIEMLVLSDTLQDTIVHEAFHALGHPRNFVVSNLNGNSNVFGQNNFIGDPRGINGIGFGLTEFRAESGNPFATFVPLAQTDDFPPAHLSQFEPTFVRLDEGFQDIFIPFSAPIGIQGTMSRAMQGMFADLGYKVRGVNAPGFVDLDGDGVEDNPLVINPTFDLDNNPTD